MLHGNLWLNLFEFFPLDELEQFKGPLHQSGVKVFHRSAVFHYQDSVALRSVFVLQVLRPPWVQLL